jgi:signal transduction histidine kinase
LRKDGALLNASLTISPLGDQQGEVIGASKIARDITDRKRAEDELRRANTDLEQFAYSASHALQEPLRTIMIYSELLAWATPVCLTGKPGKTWITCAAPPRAWKCSCAIS